eukprot:7654290-Pyramimonas_sp.AAC.1
MLRSYTSAGKLDTLYGTHSDHQYAELWVHFWDAVEDVGAQGIDIEWILLLLSQIKTNELQIHLAYWRGNKQVGFYAKRGAAMHPRDIPQERARQMRDHAAALALKTVLRILRRCSRAKLADAAVKG